MELVLGSHPVRAVVRACEVRTESERRHLRDRDGSLVAECYSPFH